VSEVTFEIPWSVRTGRKFCDAWSDTTEQWCGDVLSGHLVLLIGCIEAVVVWAIIWDLIELG